MQFHTTKASKTNQLRSCIYCCKTLIQIYCSRQVDIDCGVLNQNVLLLATKFELFSLAMVSLFINYTILFLLKFWNLAKNQKVLIPQGDKKGGLKNLHLTIGTLTYFEFVWTTDKLIFFYKIATVWKKLHFFYILDFWKIVKDWKLRMSVVHSECI